MPRTLPGTIVVDRDFTIVWTWLGVIDAIAMVPKRGLRWLARMVSIRTLVDGRQT